jgi:hypothetical protein
LTVIEYFFQTFEILANQCRAVKVLAGDASDERAAVMAD